MKIKWNKYSKFVFKKKSIITGRLFIALYKLRIWF